MKTKRLISLVLVLVMMFQTVSFALTPDDFSDFPQEDYWSFDAMASALENGLLHGKGEGVIAPKDNLTRAEFAAVVTRAFGAKKIQNIDHVKDVTENDWFYKDNSISKAYKMGVMNGTALTTFSPNLDMRRQDVFLTLARALYVEATGNEAYIADMYDKVLGKFDDADAIDGYAKNALIGMVDQGYVNGYHNEDDDVWTLKPKDSITREELAQVFYNLFKYYISDYDITEENKGVFGGTNKNDIKKYDGSMIVRTPGVTLQYAEIDGDLIIADGVGEGEFTLKGVHVKGNIIVRGGESKDDEVHRYITFMNVTSDGKVIVNNVNGTVHFNNYRNDKPFADGLIEHTKATFLERTGGGGGGGGVIGGSYRYSIHFYRQDLATGTYPDYVTKKLSASSGSLIKPFEVAQTLVENDDELAEFLKGYELYPEGSEEYEAYIEGVKIKHNNLVFKVYFVPKTYSVKFADGVLDVSGNPFDDFSEKYGTVLDNLPTEVYPEEGKTFIGWSVENDGTVDDEIKVLGDTTLYPVYTYKVTFLDPDLNPAGNAMTNVPYGYVITEQDIIDAGITDPEVEPGKKYVGWSLTPYVPGEPIETIDSLVGVEITGPVTYYQIVVDKDLVQYKVEHRLETVDGSGYVVDESIAATQTFYERPDLTATATPLTNIEGFTYFAHTEEKLTGTVLEDGSLVLTVYYNRLTYDVIFKDINGDEEKTVSDVKYGATVDPSDLPTDEDMKEPGKNFEGWTTIDGGDVDDVVDVEDVVIDGETAFYPVYTDKEPADYNVRHMFQSLDDENVYTSQFGYTDKATPDFEVTATPLDDSAIPDGFRYNPNHPDEVSSGIVLEDGSLVLSFYYDRLSYTVKFDGISEETYKYGYKLTDDDIPEDDEVSVPAGMQFMGWSTQENQTAGTSRDDLVGTEVTEEVTYYPAFAELGAVEYKIYHYFEALDGTYPEADRVEKIASAKPATTVTAEQLTGTELPEGFEYFAHDDEVLTGTVPSDGTTLELYVYYNRLTYTVKFDGISEETYKYGYKLTDDDIPEDDEVTVPSDMEFKGWSTQENQTSGESREKFVGTVVEDNLTFYPAFAEIGSVEYEIHYFFEELDGTYVEKEEFRKTDYAKPGKTVTAVPIPDDKAPEGFELRDDTLPTGTIPSDGTTLVLEVYYNRKLIKVNFYDPASDYYDSDTETYSQPSAIVEVRYGTKPDDAENLEKYIAAETDPDSNYFTFERGFEEGFVREEAYGSVYTNLTEEERKHIIPLYWWYENAQTGEYEKFYDAEVPSEFTITEEMHVYAKAYKIEIRIMVDGVDYEGFFYTFYDETTRLLDTVKDLLYVNARSITDAVEIAGVEDKGYEKFADKGVLVEVDGKYEIPNVNKLIRFSRLMGEEGFESFLASFIDDSAVTNLEEFLFDYILTHDIDETAKHLKEMVDDLVEGHPDIAKRMMDDLAGDIIGEISYVKEFFMTYTTSLVKANDTEDLEKMICEMFAEYKKKHKNEFVGFVTEVVVKALSEDTPNADIVKMISDYIKSEIKKGTYNDEIINYIMDMTDGDFKSAATAVIKVDISIIETDVKNKILTDNDFVETIIDKIFALDSETVDNKIKEYINDYNLADEYIMDNPDVIVDYIKDEQIAEFYGGYMPGIALTRPEKIDAVTQFIADDPEAVSKLKGYAGANNIKKVIGDYYDDNKDTVKDEMKTEVVANLSLRTDLAGFAMSLIKNDEFSDLLDFAIDDYLTDVLADETRKLNLAQQEVDRLNDDKVCDLGFVQDAIDSVIINDITAKETDGDENTESKYVADIKKYVKSITDFSDIVKSFVRADEDFRNEIIVALFDDLYIIDSDHTIILQFMEKVTDKMIEEGDVDINILITVIDYIREMGDHGHKLTRDIIDNLMELDDELISYVEDNLGWIDNSGKLEASLKFKKEATYEEKFEVTPLNDEFIMDKVAEKVESMTFDAFMEDFVYTRLPDKVSRDMIEKLPLDIFKNIYEKSHEDFTTSLEQARINVRNGMTDQWVNSGFFVSVNPIVEVVEPVEAYAEKAYDAANEKAASYGGRVAEIYNSFYVENPYIEDIISMYDIDNDTLENNFFEGTARSSYEPSSGFYINSFEDIYNDVVLPTSILTDDMFVWYLNKIDFAKIRSFAEDNEELILAMYNHPNVLMARYAEVGLPESMEQYYHDLMEDPAIEDAFMKIDNKVSFEMEPFFMRFLTNSTIEMYYYKALEKFGMKADVILDKYDGAEVKKEITHENFVDMLDEIEYCWKDGNAHATTNYVLDGGLKNLFSIISIEKSLKGYTVSFERGFVDR